MNSAGRQRRRIVVGGGLAACGLLGLPGCGGGGRSGAGLAASADEAKMRNALAQLDGLATALMADTGLPGMAVAVVRGDQVVYAKGFGTRVAGTNAPVDADTVFQLASVSKSLGATVVAHQVGAGAVAWDTPVRRHLPWFELSDPAVNAQLTIGDLYAHRSGLPDHAADRLEDMGYDQQEVLRRLRYLPLDTFRQSYHYTNFGLTGGAAAVAVASGADWATLSEQALYRPLGMSRTSSRFADFQARSNRVVGHVKVNGAYVPGPVRMPDAQAPAASISSSVNDVARWLSMMLGRGAFQGRRIVDADALAPAVSPQALSSPASGERPAGHYGYGFNVGTTAVGLPSFSHSGGFLLGTGTAFMVVPATGVGIVALTNASPIGVPEILGLQFFDLVQFGAIQRPWKQIVTPAFDAMSAPEGSLVGMPRPAQPRPPQSLSAYAGTYGNAYHGPLQVVQEAGGLTLVLGPAPLRIPLTHWDGDVFTFTLFNENAAPGTLSKASFAGDRVTLEYYDHEKLGTFQRGG
ncbi:serine hydrolase [Variovorax sp. JS1663]|uniref:serine hydrolase n=1 Tax=Variovorax sp. JS1663 TaxID=1851577 RepID=UPI000B34508A|nr:serine hydrolase [Variovorax sp. JS1663]OUM02211.1 serine hydrolase [Variovorax sp. JS1663]